MNIRTQSVHFDADQKLLDFIDKKLQKLGVFYDRITHADVILSLENNGQVKDKIGEVKLSVPGAVLVCKESSKSFEQSIDNCAASLKRQLIKHKERQRSRN